MGMDIYFMNLLCDADSQSRSLWEFYTVEICFYAEYFSLLS